MTRKHPDGRRIEHVGDGRYRDVDRNKFVSHEVAREAGFRPGRRANNGAPRNGTRRSRGESDYMRADRMWRLREKVRRYMMRAPCAVAQGVAPPAPGTPRQGQTVTPGAPGWLEAGARALARMLGIPFVSGPQPSGGGGSATVALSLADPALIAKVCNPASPQYDAAQCDALTAQFGGMPEGWGADASNAPVDGPPGLPPGPPPPPTGGGADAWAPPELPPAPPGVGGIAPAGYDGPRQGQGPVEPAFASGGEGEILSIIVQLIAENPAVIGQLWDALSSIFGGGWGRPIPSEEVLSCVEAMPRPVQRALQVLACCGRGWEDLGEEELRILLGMLLATQGVTPEQAQCPVC